MEVIFGRGIRFISILIPNPTCIAKRSSESVRCICCYDPKRWQVRPSERHLRHRCISHDYVPLLNRLNSYQRPVKCSINKYDITLAYYSDSKQPFNEDCQKSKPEEKVSVFKKMKQMTKDYWHVLIPVHIVTSLGWVAIFYILVKNGVDIVKIMESVNLSEKYLDLLRNSSAGNWALIYALYKIITPLRYGVTVGGTTVAVRYLNKLGILKVSSFKKQPQQLDKTLYSNVKQIYGGSQERA